MEDFKNDLFLCQCSSPDHQIIFSYEDNNKVSINDRWVYASVHLKSLGFWQRLIHGVKYIFGFKSRYGDFDEFVFKNSDADRLQKVVDYLKNC